MLADDEFGFAGGFGEVGALTDVEGQARFFGEVVRGELAEDEEADVDDVDAELGPRESEAGEVGGPEVDDEDRAEEVATGEERDLKAADVEEDDRALEVALMGEVEAFADLGEGAGEAEDHRQAEAADGQAKGGLDADERSQWTGLTGFTGLG